MIDERFCPKCGGQRKAGAAFCAYCGTGFAAMASATAWAPAPVAGAPTPALVAPTVATGAPAAAASAGPAAAPSSNPARPTGITVLAILAAIGGVLSVLGGLQLAGVGGELAGFGLLYLALGAADLGVAWGCWMLRPWAWQAGMVVCGAQAGLAMIGLLNGDVGGGLISLAVNGTVLYYLDTAVVRRVFGKGPSRMGGKRLVGG